MKEKSNRQQHCIYLAKELVALWTTSETGTHFSPEIVRWNIETTDEPSDVPYVTWGCDNWSWGRSATNAARRIKPPVAQCSRWVFDTAFPPRVAVIYMAAMG